MAALQPVRPMMSDTYKPASIAKIQDHKAKMRRSLLKARQAMPPQVWQQKCDRICTHLNQWSTFQSARTVLAYCSFRNEPDLGTLLRKHRSWGLPRCQGQDLIWHRWFRTCSWPLRSGAYGITEPEPTSPLVEPHKVDLILVPAVACDVRGYRLGYGGGFYDRMLAQPCWQGKPTIGIVFEFARLPQIPTNSWDRPLSGICTESGLFLAN